MEYTIVKKIVNYKRHFNINDAGFTLVEMTVVMGIIAVISLLGAFAMQGARKQMSLKAAAKELQSNIRFLANNAITVASDLNDSSKSSKAWAIEIGSGDINSYNIVSYYEENGEVTRTSNAQTLDLGNDITINSSDTRHLVFSTPFAKFKAVNADVITWSDPDSKTKERVPSTDPLTGTINPNVTPTVSIQLKNSTSTLNLNISTETGEVSLE